jgi:intracellular sulfur oxidation DsrE/DsrF family protein
MHKRPRLAEAIEVLQQLASISDEADEALEQYHAMRAKGLDFQACRMIVDIVDHHYHNMSVAGAVNG